MAEERIQKIMSEQGLCSRRAAEQIIAEGRVKVNGHPVKVGDKMDPNRDVLHVDDERIYIQKNPGASDHLPRPEEAGVLVALMQGGGFLIASLGPFVTAFLVFAEASSARAGWVWTTARSMCWPRSSSKKSSPPWRPRSRPWW